MGVIFAAVPCETCGYTPRPPLFYHGGKLGLFRGLATCQSCHELVSVSPDAAHIPEGFKEMFGGAEAYREHVESVLSGRGLTQPLNTCPICGSHELVHHDLWEVFTTKQPIELPCPRSAGVIRLSAAGLWD